MSELSVSVPVDDKAIEKVIASIMANLDSASVEEKTVQVINAVYDSPGAAKTIADAALKAVCEKVASAAGNNRRRIGETVTKALESDEARAAIYKTAGIALAKAVDGGEMMKSVKGLVKGQLKAVQTAVKEALDDKLAPVIKSYCDSAYQQINANLRDIIFDPNGEVYEYTKGLIRKELAERVKRVMARDDNESTIKYETENLAQKVEAEDAS
jgi:hypothetical protein